MVRFGGRLTCEPKGFLVGGTASNPLNGGRALQHQDDKPAQRDLRCLTLVSWSYLTRVGYGVVLVIGARRIGRRMSPRARECMYFTSSAEERRVRSTPRPVGCGETHQSWTVRKMSREETSRAERQHNAVHRCCSQAVRCSSEQCHQGAMLSSHRVFSECPGSGARVGALRS